MFLQKETKKRRGRLKLQTDYIAVIRKGGEKLGGIAQCKGKSLEGRFSLYPPIRISLNL